LASWVLRSRPRGANGREAVAMTLDQWQERLQGHFAQLASRRSVSDFPLFALEHGLGDEEFDEIRDLLHAELLDGWKLGRYWLLWVVYATELGYDYDGGEYWPSFEERTPNWRQPITATRRNQLRSWFTRFQKTYHGVTPSGPWAEQFSIIAWPITHAVLPRYLQWQFAKALYELRYQLAHLDTMSPIAIGQLLAANAWEAPSRFRVFLQQQELAGRIVLALFGDRTLVGEGPLYPPALERLVTDLDEVQSSREWLKETRLLIAERMKGAAHTIVPAGMRREGGEDDGTRPHFRIRPTLMLRRSTGGTWSISLDIPNLADVARSDPEFQRLLRSTRSKITGTGDTWHPKGWLTTGSRKPVLKQWPGAGIPLIQFEQPHPALDRLVAGEARLPTGPVWLCRIGADYLGREVMGRSVRPGRTYMLLSERLITSRYDFLSACKVDCDGIHAGILSLPDPVSFEMATRLQQLGLQVARTVRIFPAGLSARGFDGEGHSEWLTTEAACFGIIHDHPVDTYSLRLDNESEIHLGALGINTPVFVKIAPLPPGRHTLAVKARRKDRQGDLLSSVAEGVITLDVREPVPWIPGTTSHVGLAISLEPDSPSLDDFWEGHTLVRVLGPAGHQVICEVQLSNASGRELLAEPVATFDLPITPHEWEKKISSFIADDRRAWIFAEASSGRFLIKGEELGEFSLRLERDVKPLRWACRNLRKATTIRLIDDTGGEETPACRFFSFRNPNGPIILDTAAALSGLAVESPGGLFETCGGKFYDDVIVSIPPSGHGFADLLIEPDLSVLENDTVSTAAIFEALRRWSGARLLGPLVSMRRNRILERIANKLYASLCGRRWAEAEAVYLATPHTGFARQKLIDSVGVPHAFSVVLSHEFDRMEASTESGGAWFFDIAVRYQISSNQGLCDLALRLAGSPQDVPGMVPTQSLLDALLSDIKEKGALLRGARLVALFCASRSAGPYGGMFPRWKW
jgi:hypothetical protein